MLKKLDHSKNFDTEFNLIEIMRKNDVLMFIVNK